MRKKFGFLFFASFIIASPALASRSIMVPPYQINFTAPFNDISGIHDGDAIGFTVSYNVTVVNLSNVEQNGSLEMLPPASTETFAYSRQGGGSTLRAMDFYYDLCGNVSNSYKQATGAVEGPTTLALPSPAQFKIAKLGTASLSSNVRFYGNYGDAASPKAFTAGVTRVQPTLKINITEDSGAVSAVVAVNISGLVGNASSVTYCGGENISGPRKAPPFSIFNTSPPMLVNGGRPF